MLPKIVVMYVITITGGTFYLSKFPEKFFPGIFHTFLPAPYDSVFEPLGSLSREKLEAVCIACVFNLELCGQ